MSDATVPDVLKLNADAGSARNEFFAQLPPLSHKEAADALGIPQSPGLLASTMRDEFAAYIRGWSDGAGVHAMRPEFTSHAMLADPYNEGYADGRKARNAAHVAASEKYGVKVSVLRTPEKIGDDDQPTSPKRLRDIVTVLSDSNGCQTHSWEDVSFPSRVTKAALDTPNNGLKVCNGCLIRASRIVRETLGLGV